MPRVGRRSRRTRREVGIYRIRERRASMESFEYQVCKAIVSVYKAKFQASFFT